MYQLGPAPTTGVELLRDCAVAVAQFGRLFGLAGRDSAVTLPLFERLFGLAGLQTYACTAQSRRQASQPQIK